MRKIIIPLAMLFPIAAFAAPPSPPTDGSGVTPGVSAGKMPSFDATKPPSDLPPSEEGPMPKGPKYPAPDVTLPKEAQPPSGMPKASMVPHDKDVLDGWLPRNARIGQPGNYWYCQSGIATELVNVWWAPVQCQSLVYGQYWTSYWGFCSQPWWISQNTWVCD